MLTFKYLESLGFRIYAATDMPALERRYLFRKGDVCFERRVPLNELAKLSTDDTLAFKGFEHNLCCAALDNLRPTYNDKEGVYVK